MPSSDTQFKSNSPRCHYGHANCAGLGCEPGGQPKQWKPEYTQKMLEFFDVPPTVERETLVRHKDGTESIRVETVANRFPTFERFAFSIGFVVSTLSEWAKDEEKCPGFGEAYQKCKQIQKNFLIENGISGLYNAPFTKFVAVNITDMRDVVSQEISGRDGAPLMLSQEELSKRIENAKKK